MFLQPKIMSLCYCKVYIFDWFGYHCYHHSHGSRWCISVTSDAWLEIWCHSRLLSMILFLDMYNFLHAAIVFWKACLNFKLLSWLGTLSTILWIPLSKLWKASATGETQLCCVSSSAPSPSTATCCSIC